MERKIRYYVLKIVQSMCSEGLYNQRRISIATEHKILFSCLATYYRISQSIRYSEISTAALEIHSLVQQNLKLFGMEHAVDSSCWLDYVSYVDNVIYQALLKTVGCRYVYLYHM
jgi:hypothetical protein